MDCMNNALFSVNEFTNVCKFIACRGFDEFTKMYEVIGFFGKRYAEEKYNRAISNFSSWWCDLDTYTQQKIVEYVKDFYNKG